MIGYWAFEDDEKEVFWRQPHAERQQRIESAHEELDRTGYWVKTHEEKCTWWNKEMMWRDYVATHTSMAARGLMTKVEVNDFQGDKKKRAKEYEKEVADEATRKREAAGLEPLPTKARRNVRGAAKATRASKRKRSS